jgi:hypothetical protein
MTMLPSEAVTATIEVLEENGWCRRVMLGPGGEHCIYGAANVAVTGQHNPKGTISDVVVEILTAVTQAARDAGRISPPFDWEVSDAVHFNNAICEDAAEMITMLEKARAALQEAGR